MSPNSFLWLHGIPGYGKTILCSTIAQDVIQHYKSGPEVAVAYFYFDFNDGEKQRHENLIFIYALFDKSTKFSCKGAQVALTGRDFHIAGESFAGHWIPALGSYMVKNKLHKKVQLKSFLLGNALTDALPMGDAINKLLCGPSPPLTLIGASPADVSARCALMPTWKISCDAAIKKCRSTASSCDAALKACWESWGDGWSVYFQRNIYDVTKDEADNTASRDFFESKFAAFMNDLGRRSAFGVNPGPAWHPGNQNMVADFFGSGDWFRSYIPEMNNILNEGIDFLLYAGDQDLACPFTLVKDLALKVNWNEFDLPSGTKKELFRKCEARGENTYKRISVLPPVAYGNYIRAGHLTYARLFGAGHMISQNRPEASKHFFESWIFNRPLFQECDPGSGP